MRCIGDEKVGGGYKPHLVAGCAGVAFDLFSRAGVFLAFNAYRDEPMVVDFEIGAEPVGILAQHIGPELDGAVNLAREGRVFGRGQCALAAIDGELQRQQR